MNKSAGIIKAVFRGFARAAKTFTLEIGPLRATGMPAILLGVTGIVLASGVTAALAKSANRLAGNPERSPRVSRSTELQPKRLQS